MRVKVTNQYSNIRGITDYIKDFTFYFFLNWIQNTCYTLRKKCLYSELFWTAFSRIQTEYGEIRSISPHSVRMRENADHNNHKYVVFSCSYTCCSSSGSANTTSSLLKSLTEVLSLFVLLCIMRMLIQNSHSVAFRGPCQRSLMKFWYQK